MYCSISIALPQTAGSQSQPDWNYCGREALRDVRVQCHDWVSRRPVRLAEGVHADQPSGLDRESSRLRVHPLRLRGLGPGRKDATRAHPPDHQHNELLRGRTAGKTGPIADPRGLRQPRAT